MYYINLDIKGYSDEKCKDQRLLRLSYKVWKEWFYDYRYIIEERERIKKNLEIYIEATVIEGCITKLKWED